MTRAAKTFGYSRISPYSTKPDTKDFEDENIDELYVDKVSIKSEPYPNLKKLINKLQAGDTVVVQNIDRLASTPVNLHYVLKDILEKGATLKTTSSSFTISSDTEDNISFIDSLIRINMFNTHVKWQEDAEEKEQRYISRN